MLSAFSEVLIPVIGFGSASYIAKWIWPPVKRQILVEIEIQSHEEVHNWVLKWLQKQLSLSDTSKLHVTVDRKKQTEHWNRRVDNENPNLEFYPGDGWHFVSFHGTSIYIYYDIGKVVMTGWQQDTPSNVGTLTLWCVGRSSQVLQQLLEEARDLALERDESCTKIFARQQWGRWRPVLSIQPRALETVILDDALLQDILLDAKEFLGSERWYRDRGVPYRRGYLLYGEPGCGKTSLVKGMAGELGLDICVLSLGGEDLDDDKLKNSLHTAPKRTVLLLEDVDAIFVDRQVVSQADARGAKRVTFSGLLNALDGVASQEGRIVFMTTNHVDKLDPALVRPGRCDRKVKFELATPEQARRLFVQFFPKEDVELAASFSQEIPNKMLSMAQIQGHLIKYKNSAPCAVQNASELQKELTHFSRNVDSDITVREWLDRLGGDSLTKYTKLFEKQDFKMVEDLRGFSKQQLGQLKDKKVKISQAHQNKIQSLLVGESEAVTDFQYAKTTSVRNEFRRYFIDVDCAHELEQRLTDAVEDHTITLGQVKSIFRKHNVTESTKSEGKGSDSNDREESAKSAVDAVISLSTNDTSKPTDLEAGISKKDAEKKTEKDKLKESVSEILEELELSLYLTVFEGQDCDSLDLFKELKEEELKDVFDIQVYGHRKKILKEVEKYKKAGDKKEKKDKEDEGDDGSDDDDDEDD